MPSWELAKSDEQRREIKHENQFDGAFIQFPFVPHRYLHNPIATGGMQHKVNFQSTTSLNSEAKKLSLPYLPIVIGKNKWIHAFPKGISAKWNPNDLIQDLNQSPIPFPNNYVKCATKHFMCTHWSSYR